MNGAPEANSTADLGFWFRVLLLAVCIIVATLLLWQLIHLLLLVFGAVLVAVLLRAFADLIERYTPLQEKSSLAAAVVVILLLIAGFIFILGAQIQQQMFQLASRIPDFLESVEKQSGVSNIEEWLAARIERALDSASIVANVAGYSSAAAGIAANALLVLVGGVYIAIHPRLYRKGFFILLPREARSEAAETITLIGEALKLWLLGQLLAMAFVGALIALGLTILGVPSALALGLIAGLLEFVPYVGPVLSAVPGIATAFTQSPVTALWVAGLYLVVQQLEGILITPLIQQRTVDLPPALTLFAIVAFGMLLGPLGVLFATPLTVVCFVLVKKLWIRETLEEETTIPGETEPTE